MIVYCQKVSFGAIEGLTKLVQPLDNLTARDIVVYNFEPTFVARE